MTQSQFDGSVTAAIAARIAAEPVLSACVCGSEDEPDVDVDQTGATLICCDFCDRSVAAPTRDEATQLWNAAMRSDPAREGLNAVELAYLTMLQMPHDSLRCRSQHVLCALRDFIAQARGLSAETVQNEFESLAIEMWNRCMGATK